MMDMWPTLPEVKQIRLSEDNKFIEGSMDGKTWFACVPVNSDDDLREAVRQFVNCGD